MRWTQADLKAGDEPPKGLHENDLVRASFVPEQAQITKFNWPEVTSLVHDMVYGKHAHTL